MGVLVGTSLIVIIPEGIETLYTAQTVSTQALHQPRAASAQLDTTWARVQAVDMDESSRMMVRDIVSDRVQAEKDHAFNTLPGPVVPGAAPKTNPNIPKPAQQKNPPDFHTQDAGGAESSPAGKKDSVHQERSPHAYVGLSLIFGFILMYLIDQIPQHASRSLRSTSQPHHISLANLGQGLRRISSQNGELVQAGDAESGASPSSARGFSTTIGLVIHAAADGIAMGASSSSANNRLGFIIFLAIMVHKAPAAFGLTSVLLKQGLTKREARARLTIFSLAAPFGAVATWTVVSVLGPSRMGGEEGTHWWTGILLLFSAGTFLLVFSLTHSLSTSFTKTILTYSVHLDTSRCTQCNRRASSATTAKRPMDTLSLELAIEFGRRMVQRCATQ